MLTSVDIFWILFLQLKAKLCPQTNGSSLLQIAYVLALCFTQVGILVSIGNISTDKTNMNVICVDRRMMIIWERYLSFSFSTLWFVQTLIAFTEIIDESWLLSAKLSFLDNELEM